MLRLTLGRLEIPSECVYDIVVPGAGHTVFLIKTDKKCQKVLDTLKAQEQKQILMNFYAEDREGRHSQGQARIIERSKDQSTVTYELVGNY